MLLRRALHRSLLQICRHFQRSAVRNKNYEGDYAQTTLSLLDDEEGQLIYIDAINTTGFRFQSGIRTIGSVALFPKSVLNWNVTDPKDINEASLSLFTILEPKLDILILGIGKKGNQLSPDVIKYLRSKKINVEVLPTDQAVSTFNYLNNERRYVAAGLIPPSYLSLRDNISSASEDTILRMDELFHGDVTDIRGEHIHPTYSTIEKEGKLFEHKGITGSVEFITRKEKEEEDKIKKRKIDILANDDSILSQLNVDKPQKMSFDKGEVIDYEHLKTDKQKEDVKTEKLNIKNVSSDAGKDGNNLLENSKETAKNDDDKERSKNDGKSKS